jgi:hypothetical protein
MMKIIYHVNINQKKAKDGGLETPDTFLWKSL